MGRGSLSPAKNPTLALGPSGFVSTGLRVQPITELTTILMINFKCLHEVRIFSVSEKGDNGLGDEGADGGNAPHPEFLG